MKLLLKIFVFLHNISYKIIGKLAIKLNGGVHPKHDIMKYHQFFIDNIMSNESVIDIGCGKGENAFDIAQKAKSVIGIDIKLQNIDIAKSKYVLDNLEYVYGDALTYDFKDKTFDKIVLSNVLEHIDNRVSFLKDLHKLSDVILLRVPMITRDWLAVYEKEQGLEYRLDPTHFVEYELGGLKEELSEGGWVVDSWSIQFGEFWGVLTPIDTFENVVYNKQN